MDALEFSLKAIENVQQSDKEDALDVLLYLSMNMPVQLRVFLVVYLKAHLHLRLKLRVDFRLQLSCI